MGNAGHHPLQQANVARILKRTEAERVEEGDRPGPHGEDVPQDSAHAGRRPLERLHGGGMVMALDLEGQPLAFAKIHHAGVLARPHQDVRTAGGKTGQQGA